MSVEKPAILVSPREYPVEPEEIDALARALSTVTSGQVVRAAFPVQLHHLIDGLWIESCDLPNVLVKADNVDKNCSENELHTE